MAQNNTLTNPDDSSALNTDTNTNTTDNVQRREEQFRELNASADTLFDNLCSLFNEKVVGVTFDDTVRYVTLLTFKFSDEHRTAGQFTKLIFEKTKIISRFQQWLNQNYNSGTNENGKPVQKYFAYFCSSNRGRRTRNETFFFNVNWDKNVWHHHKPIQTGTVNNSYCNTNSSNPSNNGQSRGNTHRGNTTFLSRNGHGHNQENMANNRSNNTKYSNKNRSTMTYADNF